MCNCGKRRGRVPVNYEAKPGALFPGEKGFALLVAKEATAVTGAVTGQRYEFPAGVERYVDKRDLPDLDRECFERLDDAHTDATSSGAQETPELDGDSKRG